MCYDIYTTFSTILRGVHSVVTACMHVYPVFGGHVRGVTNLAKCSFCVHSVDIRIINYYYTPSLFAMSVYQIHGS